MIKLARVQTSESLLLCKSFSSLKMTIKPSKKKEKKNKLYERMSETKH
jgi:hypothetical protein